VDKPNESEYYDEEEDNEPQLREDPLNISTAQFDQYVLTSKRTDGSTTVEHIKFTAPVENAKLTNQSFKPKEAP
jgi:hypothetical protein